MRHHKTGIKLNRTTSHRNAMFRNMVTSLFKYDKIKTTDVKAKELRRWADHLITLAKKGDLHARRQALAIVREKDVVYKLFDEAQTRYGEVQGGYTRIIKIGRRPGDAALVSQIELVSSEKGKKKQPKNLDKKQETKKAIPATQAVKAETAVEKPEKTGATAPVSEDAEIQETERGVDTEEKQVEDAGAAEAAKDDSKE